MAPPFNMYFLHSCRAVVQQHPEQQQQQKTCLPDRIVISTGRSRQRDHISGILRDSIVALLAGWQSPFAASTAEGGNSSKLEAGGQEVAEWIVQVCVGTMT